MREEFDDPGLTAYVLGELSDAERAEVEARMAASAEVRDEVEAIRDVVALVRDGLAGPAGDELAPVQRARVEAAASASPVARRYWRLPLGLAAAASVAAAAWVSWRVVGVPVLPERTISSPPTVAAGPVVAPPTAMPPTAERKAPPAAVEQAARRAVAGEALARTDVPAPMADGRRPIAEEKETTSSTEGANEVVAPRYERARRMSPQAVSSDQLAKTSATPFSGVPGGVVGGMVGGLPEAAPPSQLRLSSAPFNTEAYDHVRDNAFVLVSDDPRSTFSVDVDTASYSNVRRFLQQGVLPPKDAVRIEELVNYFRYDYPGPEGEHPFAVHLEEAACPWKPEHRLVRIGIKGRELPQGRRPPTNLVFLLDVSGSMAQPNKLPLVKQAMRLLVDGLGAEDRVAIVVYAGAEGLALPSTRAREKETILGAIESLSPGGTTHGSAGLRLAYETAQASFLKGGVNRVILATDGDFNVGVTNQGDLVRLIEEKTRGGVFLTVLGFGMGNYKDSTLEKLADHGNGNYAYIDDLWEARKVLVEQAGSTLVTIAKDVKLQLEFNPAAVQAFRLVGYENRVLAHRDFNDDQRDAGDIGAGHTVTALYEVVPAGVPFSAPGVDPLRYQQPARPGAAGRKDELLTVKLRYKRPDEGESRLIERPFTASGRRFEKASADFRFAAAVASFGLVLRDSPHKGSATLGDAEAWARDSLGGREVSRRAEFLSLVEKARLLSPPAEDDR